MDRSIDELPLEILALIFEHLTIRHLLSVRSTCKRFIEACDWMKVKDCIIAEKNFEKNYWWFNHRPIDCSDALNWATFHSTSTTFQLPSNLKHLYIGYFAYRSIDLSFVCEFPQLEILEIDSPITSTTALTLPNLNKLRYTHSEFFDEDDEVNGLILNTPKLEFLKTTYRLQNISLISLHSLKHLEIHSYQSEAASFVNLEYLRIDDTLNDFNRDLLSSFKELKHLVIYMDIQVDLNDFRDNTLVYLLEQRTALRRLDLMIYFQGVRLVDIEMAMERDLEVLDWSREWQMANYENLLDYLPFDKLNYSNLVQLVDVIPADLHIKFFYVDCIETDSDISGREQQFSWFIKQFRFVHSLLLKNSKLDQSFLDQLPQLIPHLKCLKVRDQTRSYNFDFVFKFSGLSTLHLMQECFQIDLAIELFEKLEFFDSLLFEIGSKSSFGSHFQIHKVRKHTPSDGRPCIKYKIYTSLEIKMKKDTLDRDELIKLTNYLKKHEPIKYPRMRSLSMSESDSM